MENGFEKRKGLIRLINILLIVLIIVAASVFITYLWVFGSMIIFGGAFSASTDGLLGFFIETLEEGQKIIEGKDLALSAMPTVFGLFCLLSECILLKSFFKKMLKKGSYYYKGATAKLVTMTVIAFLWAIVPFIISEYAVRTLNNEFFSIVQWKVMPYLIIAFVMLAVTVIYNSKSKRTENSL